MESFLLPCVATGVSLFAAWGLSGATASGAAVDDCRDAPAWARRAARAAASVVVDVPRALAVSPHVPCMTAQRVARYDPYNIRNCLPPKKLRREIP